MISRRSLAVLLSTSVLLLVFLLFLIRVGSEPGLVSSRAAAPAAGARSDDPSGRAVIRRDRHGVAHILADDEEAAAFAHGYVSAEDHGALLARAFLRARGALASELGPAFADEDLRVRTLRIHDIASLRFRELPPFMQAILNGYAAGYNRVLEGRRGEFPDWASPATGVDVLAHCRAVMLMDFALDLTPWNVAPPRSSSTMWAVGRPLSASGRGMLLANPHLGWDDRQLLHEVHITVPGLLNVNGASPVGVPVVTIGFNEALGWSHTVNRFDGDDVYELTLDESGGAYAYDGRWLPLERRTVPIAIRTAGGVEAREHTVLWSHYGPIVRTEGGRAWAFKSASLDAVNFLTQYNAMAKATTLRRFTAALNMQELPTFNIAYADREGNVWYVFNGRLPIRPAGYDWRGVVPGDTSRTEWFAVRPLSELPQLLNPKSGYVQNSNNAPWYANLEQPIDRARFAHVAPQETMTWRGRLSLGILSAEREMTLSELMAYKHESRDPVADRVKDELLAALRARAARWSEAAALLAGWDNRTDPGSRGAVLFRAWWEEYSHSRARPFRTAWSAADPVRTPGGIADPAGAVAAFERAAAAVVKAHGALDVAWGDVHRLRRGTVDLPAAGTDTTFQNAAYARGDDGKYVLEAGDTYVLAVEFTDPPRAFSVLPYSQASNPRSPYFNNQLQIYAAKQYKPALFSEQEIAANLDRQYRPGS